MDDKQMQSRPTQPYQRQWIAGVVLGVVLLSAGLTITKKTPGEYAVYNRAANRLLQGETFYRTDERSAFSYPPFFVLPGIPLSFLPEQSGRFCWYVVNLSLLVISIVLLNRMIKPLLKSPFHQLNPRYRIYLFLIGVLGIRHATSPIENQSHEFFILVLVVLTLYQLGKNNSPASGIWVGLATACKATPLLFLPFLIWSRRWQHALVMVVVIASATLLLDLFFQNPDGQWWGVSWYSKFASHTAPGKTANAMGAWTDWNILNQSLAGSLFRLTVPLPYQSDGVDFFETHLITFTRQQCRWLTLAAQAGVLLLVFYFTFSVNNHHKTTLKEERSFLALGHGAVVVCGMLLLSPMTSKAHLCLLLLPISYVVTDFMYRNRSRLIGTLLMIIFITGPVTSKSITGNFFGNRLLGFGFPTWCILACLIATGIVLKSRSKAMQNSIRTGQFGIESVSNTLANRLPTEDQIPHVIVTE